MSKERKQVMQATIEKRGTHLEKIDVNKKDLDYRIQEKNDNKNERLKKIDQQLQKNKQEFERKIMLRQEREHLKIQDAQRNIERQKWQREQQKIKIMNKHQMIQDRVDQLKETKLNISEFSRISNQIRVKQVVQCNQAKQDAFKTTKYTIV